MSKNETQKGKRAKAAARGVELPGQAHPDYGKASSPKNELQFKSGQIAAIEETAALDAKLFVALMKELGVSASSDGLNVIQFYKRTLGSLFRASQQPDGSYSPKLKALALRCVLNPCARITGTPNRFKCTRDESGWEIHEFSKPEHALLPSFSAGRRIEFPVSVAVLDCVLSLPRKLDALRQLIVDVLRHEPTFLEELPRERRPRFTYRIGDQNGSDRSDRSVKLWIEGNEVMLSRSDDVHKLLENLCATTKLKLTGSKAKKFGISNPSRARENICEALGKILPEAAAWLTSNPIGWADGNAPKPRRRTAD